MSSLAISPCETALSYLSNAFVPALPATQVERYRDTVKTILESHFQEEAYLQVDGNLLRSAIIIPPDSQSNLPGYKIIIWNRNDADNPIGNGTEKTYFLGVDLLSGNKLAVASLDCTESSDREVEFLSRFKGKEGVIQLLGSVKYLSSSQQGNIKRHLVFPHYSLGDFESALIKHSNLLRTLDSKAILFERLVACVFTVHQEEYLHRDVKPANFLLENRGNLDVALIDLGYACKQKPDTERTGVRGTPFYVPPEQAAIVQRFIYDRRCNSLTPSDRLKLGNEWIEVSTDKSDVWSFGLTLLNVFRPHYFYWIPELKACRKDPLKLMNWTDSLNTERQLFKEPEKDTPLHLVWRMLQINPKDRIGMKEAYEMVGRLKRSGKFTKENFEKTFRLAQPFVSIPETNWEKLEGYIETLSKIPKIDWGKDAEAAIQRTAQCIVNAPPLKEIYHLDPKETGAPHPIAIFPNSWKILVLPEGSVVCLTTGETQEFSKVLEMFETYRKKADRAIKILEKVPNIDWGGNPKSKIQEIAYNVVRSSLKEVAYASRDVELSIFFMHFPNGKVALALNVDKGAMSVPYGSGMDFLTGNGLDLETGEIKAMAEFSKMNSAASPDRASDYSAESDEKKNHI